MKRFRLLFSTAVIAGLLAWGCSRSPGIDTAAAAEAPVYKPAVASAHQQLRRSQGWLVDAQGRVVILHGVNAVWKQAPYVAPDSVDGFTAADADWLAAHGFNAVRLPFVPDTLYNTTPVDQLSAVNTQLNADLVGKTPLQVLDLWMSYADSQGLYVVLDFHSVSMQRQYPTWFVGNAADYGLVYNGQAYTEADWIRDLTFVARRYAGLPHFMGIDLYNEPEGVVRWSSGDANVTDPALYWKSAAEQAGSAVLQANPRLLVFVEGINGNFDGRENSAIPMNWGEDFQPQAYQPLDLPANKLVLSPHTYGPDVYEKSSFSASNYPANLAANWDALFGQYFGKHAVVIGEWGGRYGQGPSGQKDVVWQQALVSYLLANHVRDSFYWCYTPNSADSGGILDDNLQVRKDKMELLDKLWGNKLIVPQQ